MPQATDSLIAEAQDTALKDVIEQLTKNLLDGTMRREVYRTAVEVAVTRLDAARDDDQA